MLPLIRRIAGNSPVFTPTIQDNERAMSGEVLAEELGSNAVPAQRLRLALDAAAMTKPADAEQPVVLCGSLYLLGEFLHSTPIGLRKASPLPHKWTDDSTGRKPHTSLSRKSDGGKTWPVPLPALG